MHFRLISIIIYISAFACAKPLTDFESKLDRRTDSTQILLYSFPHQYEETRIYDKTNKLKTLRSRLAEWEIQIEPDEISLRKFGKKSFLRYVFKKNENKFNLSRISVSLPQKYYLKSERCLSKSSGLEKIDLSCEENQKLVTKAESVLTKEGRVSQCLAKFDYSEVPSSFNEVQIACSLTPNNQASSNYDPILGKINLGANFLALREERDSAQAAEILLHELIHKNDPRFNKEKYCGENGQGLANAEKELQIITNCCVSGKRCQEVTATAKFKDKSDEINKLIKREFHEKNIFFDEALLRRLAPSEANYVLDQINSSLGKFGPEVFGKEKIDTIKCQQKLSEIFKGDSCVMQFGCPFIDKKNRFFVPVDSDELVKNEENSKKMGSLKTESFIKPIDGSEKQTPESQGAIVASNSISSSPLDLGSGALSDSKYVETVGKMIPDSASVGSFVNDVQNSATALVTGFNQNIPGEYPVSAAVSSRVNVSLVTGDVTSGLGSSPLSAWNLKLNVISGTLPLAQATTRQNPPILRSQSSVSNLSTGDSAISRAPTSVSSGAGDQVNNHRGVSKSLALSANLSQDPVSYVNQKVRQAESTSEILNRLKSEEKNLARGGVQVIYGSQTFGAKKSATTQPKHVLIWRARDKRFVEEL